MLRIAIQTKGRLNEQSMELLHEIGIDVDAAKRKFLSQATNFPIEVLYLRDDDIPQVVANGTASLGIVGLNEVAERGCDVEVVKKLGFGGCRISLAIPKGERYDSVEYFCGKRIATSYPKILGEFLAEHGVEADMEVITGSVEIAPAAGIADAIFDIVSSGGTLITNGLVEVEQVLHSEAVLIGTPGLSEEKMAIARQLMSRFESVLKGAGKKYLLLNIPTAALDEAVKILPAMRSPTVIPLAQKDWCSLQTVVDEKQLWSVIEQLKAIGAEDILVLALEKIVL